VALLAGLAAARHGTCEALELLDSRPDIELRVRAGEGLEPAGLLDHPRVSRASGLDGIDLVVAPAWCESYPAELAGAIARGIPVVGTRRAAGFVDLAGRGAEVPPGDTRALAAALDIAIAFPSWQDEAARWRARAVLGELRLADAFRS
jgi:glycosyltransferase involved in cell wall biosynthesis